MPNLELFVQSNDLPYLFFQGISPHASALNNHGHLREKKVPSESSPARSIARPVHLNLANILQEVEGQGAL